jgi:hypothetical protein
VQENVFAYSNGVGFGETVEERGMVFYNNAYQSASGWITHSLQSMVKEADGSKHLANRSVAEALGLKGYGDEYCLFREQRSGLWFIRSGRDICDRGLFVSLQGYECQVLLDFKNVYDSADGTGKWAALCKELGGRGVPDIDQALWDVFLRDLYAAFEEAASPAFFKDIADYTGQTGIKRGRRAQAKRGEKKKVLKLSTILQEHKAAVMGYYQVLDAFLRGNYGAQSILNSPGARGPKRQKDTWLVRGWNSFYRRVLALEPVLKEGVYARLRFIMGRSTDAVPLLAGWALLAAFADAAGKRTKPENVGRLITTWRFDRRLAGILSLQGHGDFAALHQKVLVLLDLMQLTPGEEHGDDGGEQSPKERAAEVVETLAASPSAPVTLGVNTFEGVRWFNKERTECAIHWASIAAVLYAGDTPEKACKVTAKLMKTGVQAGYKLDNWLRLLRPKGKQHDKPKKA